MEALLSAGGPTPERIQLSTSGVVDAASDLIGIQASNADKLEASVKWLEEKDAGSMQLIRGQGISGENSLERTEEDLSNQNLPRNKVLTFRL